MQWLRLAFLLVCFAIGASWSPSAHAVVYPTQGEAFQACEAARASWPYSPTLDRPSPLGCSIDPNFHPRYVRCYYEHRPNTNPGTAWATALCGNFEFVTSCAALQTTTGTCNANKGGQCTAACFSGCKEVFIPDVPPNEVLVTEGPEQGLWKHGKWDPNGETCNADDFREDGPDQCPEGQKQLPDGSCAKQGECPVGMHEAPPLGACTPDGACPTGKQKAPDGSCVDEQCPPGFAKKKNGTCGLDENNDGVPDEEDPGNEDGNKASGGDTCDAPPVCSGDPVMCLQTKIQWRIDCNTRKNQTVSGGACTAPPICTGESCKAVEYASLMMQWRTACAVEKAGQGGGGGTDMTGVHSRLDRIGNFLDGNGQGVPEAPEVPFSEEEIEGEEWSSGLAGTASCPAPVSTSVSILGTTAPIEFEFQPICDFALMLRKVVIALGFIVAGFIVVGVRR